jgi:predicted lactoylglutathione lyase
MSTKLFVNLPVKDLNRSKEFFSALGFRINPQFTDENAACLVISDDIYVMLLVEKFFQTFTPKEITDSGKSTEVINALMVDSRARVDQLAEAAFLAGARPVNPPQDNGWMYGRSFQDLYGHLWEVGWMDPDHIQPLE